MKLFKRYSLFIVLMLIGNILLANTFNVSAATNIDKFSVNKLAVGLNHSLILKNDGTVVVWGSNNMGQCDVPAGLSNVVSVEAGGAHSLALKSDGTVVAWGSNRDGQCNVPQGLNDVVAISAGDSHSLALKKDGTVVAWGFNYYGQSNVPADLKDVKFIKAGMLFSLAIKNDGTMVKWGYVNNRKICDIVTNPNDIVSIKTIYNETLVLKSDGTVDAFGEDFYGTHDMSESLKDIAEVGVGYSHLAALKKDGTVIAWGDNSHGQCDVPEDMTPEDVTAPVISITGISNEQFYVQEVTPNVSANDNRSGVKSLTATLDGNDYTLGSAITGAGKHILTVTATDNANNVKTSDISFYILDKVDFNIDPISVNRGEEATLKARVTINGQPLKGVSIAFSVNDNTIGRSVVTSEEGIATVSDVIDLPSGDYTLKARFVEDPSIFISTSEGTTTLKVTDNKTE